MSKPLEADLEPQGTPIPQSHSDSAFSAFPAVDSADGGHDVSRSDEVAGSEFVDDRIRLLE